MARLVRATFLEEDTSRQKALEDMAAAAWQQLVPVDVSQLKDQPCPVLYGKLQELMAFIPEHLKNPARQAFFATYFRWLPPQVTTRQQLKQGSKQKALQHVDLLLQCRTLKNSDKHLCKQILAGVLDGDTVAQAMITYISKGALMVTYSKSH